MDKKSMLSNVRDIYDSGQNMMRYLNSETGKNDVDDVMIAYDFQAGTAIEDYERGGALYRITNGRVREMIEAMKALNIDTFDTVLEAGAGDGTFIACLLQKLDYTRAYAFDLCWSRVFKAFGYTKKCHIKNLELFQGELLHIPLKDNSMDLVYTVEAIEANTDQESEILKELYRVSRKYVFLLEPLYEMADDSIRERMENFGYVKNISRCIDEMECEVIYRKQLPEDCYPSTSPIALTIIRKESRPKSKISKEDSSEDIYIDPITGSLLCDYKDSLWSEKSMLAYPKIKGIPVLLQTNAVVATHYH